MSPTMRVIMLADAVGCPDGFTRTSYTKGQQYDLPESLARCFFSAGQADPAEAHEAAEEERRMAARFAPALQPSAVENAGATAAPEGGGSQAGPEATAPPPRPRQARARGK